MSGNYFPTIWGIFVILTRVSASFINFEPGFEYQYKYDANANLKHIGEFQVLAKVGYINVGNNGGGQEIYVKMYALAIKTKHTEDAAPFPSDLSKWFSFVITPHGEILHVYHPPDDDDEAVAMKKGAAAMFASRLHHATEDLSRATKDGWGYQVRETGNEGLHNATYTVRPTTWGHVFTKTRHPGHHPIKHATSEYTKTLHYDKELGTVHSVHVEEEFKVMHKTAEGFNPFENTRPVKAANDFTELEYPEMSAQGSGKLVFLSRHKVVSIPSRPKTGITRASIQTEWLTRKKPRVDVKEYLQYVKGNLSCMRNEPEKGSIKLDKCFDKLRSVLNDLPDEQVTRLAGQYLFERPRLTKTFKDQNHMFDAIASLTTDLSQQLLLDLVLNRSRPDSFLVKRLMFHIISLDGPPIDNVITKLKSLCFERKKAPKELQETDTYNMMVLTFGAVSRQLWDAGRTKEAVDIVQNLENRLGLHDPWLFRQKRSTMTEREVLDDDHRRVILLGSLGNAGLDQSFEMIVSHVNTTNSQWVKRAGIHAMRKYRHEGAAHLMLKTALYDDDEKVRYEALLQYQAHPKAAIIAPMYRQQGVINGSVLDMDNDNILTQDIRVHDRHKRGFMDKKLEFKLASPSLDWKKMLGSTTIGASFGLIMTNTLDFKIAPLSGFMKVDVHDEVFARIHLGFMNRNVDFFLASVCFKGEASYDLNVLQEFAIDNLKKLVELYDAIKGDAVDAIKNGIDLFKSIINGEFSIPDMINDFKEALEELPEKVVNVGKKAAKAMEVLGQLDEKQLPPFIRPARNLVIRVTNLYKEVKSSALSFYNELMETVTVIVPRAGKVIFKAIQAIIDSFETFNDDPKEAISTVAGNVLTIGLEVKNLIDVLNKTGRAVYSTIKEPPQWMKLGSHVQQIITAGIEAGRTMATEGDKWLKDVGNGHKDPVAEFSKGKSNMTMLRKEVVTMLTEIVDDVMVPLDSLRQLGRKFIETFKDVFTIFAKIKDAYNTLKEGYRTARSLISRVFGPKCHKLFPRTLRQPGGGCSGSGSYPSQLETGPEYQHEGVDVTIADGADIVAPFPGNVMLSDSPNEVILMPTGGSLKSTEVIITNIDPDNTFQHPSDPDYVDTPVSAGQKIGVAANSPCGENSHIHFALRRKGDYVDPTRYLEPRLPGVPKWLQGCNDFRVVFKGNTIKDDPVIPPREDSDQTDDTSPERMGQKVEKPDDLDSSKDPTTDGSGNVPIVQQVQSHQTQVKEKAKKTKDPALKRLFKRVGSFLKQFSIRNLKMGSILDLLEILGLDESQEKMAEVVLTIKEMIDNKPCFNPYQMTDDQLRTELTERGMRAEGTREHMINSLTTPSNSCPLMKISMPNNIYCTFDDKCLGLECCVHFNLFMLRKTYKMFARFDPCDLKFSVGAGNFNKSFGIGGDLEDKYTGFEKKIRTGVLLDILGGIELVIEVKLEKDDTAALITVAAGFCSQDDHDNCIAFFNILDEFPTPLPICHPDGSITWPEVDFLSLLDIESIRRRIQESAKTFAAEIKEEAMRQFLDFVPCISSNDPGHTGPCVRPDALTHDILSQKLRERGLDTMGSRADLEQRLTVGHKTCRVLNRTFTLPPIMNEEINKIVYMEIAPDCLRVDACVNVNIKAADFNKAVSAYLQLDPCQFTLTINFEDCTETVILLGYEWGKAKTYKLNEWVSIRYTIDRNEARKVFVVDMGLEISVGDSDPILNATLVENFNIPIPVCNDEFSLPGGGSLKDLAELMGGNLIREVVDVVFQQLGLDKVMSDGNCAALTPQPDCPWSLPDYKKLLPASFRDNVNCKLPDNCFGVECCVDFSFDIPLFEKPLVKHVPFFLKFDPCNFTVEVGFGSYHHKERLLTYNWGTENLLEIGKGDQAPVAIKFTVSKYQKGFLVDLSVHMCIPIDGNSFCYPEGGMTLMNQEKIPACDANALVEFTKQNFSVSDWLRDLDLDINLQSLSQAAAQSLLNSFRISEYLLDERCDVSRPPYSPSIGGWSNDCPESIRYKPDLPDGLFCHLADTCTKINCCFHVPFLEMSFNAVLNVDTCDYVIYTSIENKTTTTNMFDDSTDLEAGMSPTLDIANVFHLKLGLKKKDTTFVLDLNIEVCLEEDSCLLSVDVLKGTEVPQPICDLTASWNFKNFSLSNWAQMTGQNLMNGLSRSAVNYLLEQLGIKDKMLDPPCLRTSLKYQPADAGNWKKDCNVSSSAVTLPPISLPANCYINDKCLGIDCCLHSNVLDLSLHTTFNIDLCNYLIDGSIEKFSFKHNILNYDWGKEEVITFGSVPILRLKFKIDRLLSQQVFIVDLSASLCLEGDDCELDLKVLNQTRLPMPGCAKFQGFKLPGFSLDNWLRENGGEITAQLSTVLMEELGIKQFLLDRPCQDDLEPYNGTVGGWNNACPDNITLPPLPPNVFCHVTDYCTGVTCCVKVSQVKRNFNAYLFLDSCNYNLRVGIDKLEFSHTLFNYTWGEREVLDIGGLVRIEYTINSGQKKFLVNLSLKVCLTAGEGCQFTFPVFTDMILPKPFCDWEATEQLKDFSLGKFVTSQGGEMTDKLTRTLVDKLVDTLGLSGYLSEPQCSLDGRGTNGWNSECLRDVSLPPLPDSVSCSLPDHCTGIDCCLSVPLISRNVHFKVDLDMCKMTLTLAIEKLEFSRLLLDYPWGTPGTFNLKGIFRADYTIDNLEGENQFLVSLNISACFEAVGTCLVALPVLNQARFPNPGCDWNSTLSLKGFSLKNWLNGNNLNIGQALTSAFRFQLSLALGISEYLLDPMCDRQRGIYKPDAIGWNNECPKNLTLPTLPSSLSCHIPDYCTGLDCCVDVVSLGMSFNFKILLDSRNLVLTVGIEKLTFQTSLLNYKWGEWEHFNLNGVVRLNFKIDDLVHAWKYLQSFNLSLCFEADKSCVISLPVLTDVSFPKLVWNWNRPFSKTGNGFSLKSWLTGMKLPFGQQLSGLAVSQLLDRLGVTSYLRDPQCDRALPPYAGSVGGWKKDCPARLSLSTLPDSVTCHLSDPCGSIQCCIDVDFIGRSFNVQIGIDPCTYTFTMGIEKLVFTRALSSYKWGKQEHSDLKGVVRVDFMIDDLFGEKKFLINLNISVCFEEDSCLISFPALKDVKIPKLVCDWESTAALADFVLSDFLGETDSVGLTSLTSVVADKLFERLGISEYLKTPQCQITKRPYVPAVTGWNNECPVPGLDQYLPELPDSMACHVPDICTAIDCCIDIDFLSRAFNVFLTVDMCTYQLTVGVENLVYKRMLFDYQWGREDHFYVKGVIRVSYTINHLSSERKLEVTAAVSVCLKQNECLFSKTFLDKAKIPQPLCDWEAMLKQRNFSLSNWASGKGLSSTVSTLSDTLISQLLDDLGVSQYLLSPACDQSASPYSPAGVNNWNGVCSNITVPSLPDSLRCYLHDNCSTVGCCVDVPLINRAIQMTFDVDICNLQITITFENLSSAVSLLEYEWGTNGLFILGSMVHLTYNLRHIPASQKLVIDLRLKICFEGNTCVFDVPVLSNSELVYSPCNSSPPMSLRGLSLDFWKVEKCALQSSDCQQPLPAAISSACRLTDNCMGITCCVDVDLKYLGIYSITAGIEVDHCNDQLVYHIENKEWTKNLQTVEYDKNHTVSVGSDISLSYFISKTPSLYEVSFHLKICTTNGLELPNTCYYYKFLDTKMFQVPSCVLGGRRRRKRDVLDLMKTGDVKRILREALKQNYTNDEIKNILDRLKAEAKRLSSEVLESTEKGGMATNTKSAIKKMGIANPGTILYSGEVGGGNVVLGMEGGEKIMKVLGQVTDILGRGDQAYTVGKGLTGKGLQLLGAKLANMSIGEMIAMFDAKNIDPELALRLTRQLRDLAFALYSDIVNAILNRDGTNSFSSFDIILKGDFSLPRTSIGLFSYKKSFLVGGLVPMTFETGAGASYGMNIAVGAKILGMKVFGEAVPFGSAHVYGELGIGLGMYGKLRIDGYLMNVQFPTRAEIGFSKFPLDLSLIMDIDLIPVILVLKGLVTIEIKFPKVKKTLYEAEIFRYTAPVIKKRLLDTVKKEEDTSPPEFLDYVDKPGGSGQKKKAVSTSRSCLVRQLPDRDYTEPAVEIAIAAQDDRSQVQIFVDAGTKPGLSDVLSGEKLGGPSTIITQRFPQSSHGAPVFFTVYGENSAGARSTVTCSIPTYDVTPPGGRLTPDFSSTSNPAELRGNVVVYDDSDLVKSSVGVGLGRGIYGDEVIAYNSVNLKKRNSVQYDFASDNAGHEALKHFTGLKNGRLIGPVFAEFFSMNHAGPCVKECMKFPETKCMSVNYDYGPKGHCELLEGIEGHDYKIFISDKYAHFERLGVGLAHEFIYKDLSLRHGVMYYFNIHLINDLQFESILHSKGVIVDLTPPEPGPLAHVSLDVMEVKSCASLAPYDRSEWRLRCRGANNQIKNHRIIHDGPGSKTIFNGDIPFTDLLYTRASRFISANWDGIMDKETGILGYSWTVGRQICEELIHPHHDPHRNLFDESAWTNTGVIVPRAPYDPLPDGKYYVTLRALNKVEYGGPLATTICHTTPLGIDNTPPFLYEIYNISYNEDTFTINAQFNASDPESDIREADLCLGQTKRDCHHMKWQRSSHNDGDITHQFQIPGGTPVWIKVRVINNVDLGKVGVSDHAIVVDTSPPEPGIVYDGPVYKLDLNFTKDADEICANWVGFHDPDSGISHYELSVLDDTNTTISEPVSLDHKTHETCLQLDPDQRLEHGKAYNIYITAFNAGHKQLNVSAMSDGVIVDLTPPVPGEVVDGIRDGFDDVEFSTHVATVGTQWRNHSDPESAIREYAVQILRAKNPDFAVAPNFEVVKDWKTLGKDVSQIEWHNFHLNHQDVVKMKLKTINNALGTVEQTTDGFVVDLTPPRMVFLGDGREQNKDAEFQLSNTTVEANFEFIDEESGLDHFKYRVYQLYQGSKHQIYPESGKWAIISDPSIHSLSQPGLRLKPGALYSVRVGAANKAGAVAAYDTNGVLLDNTPPKMKWVYAGILSGNVEEVIDGYIVQSDSRGIKATWFATDIHSGIKSYMVAVGTSRGGTDILDWKDVGSDRNKYVDGLTLTVTDLDTMTPVYYVSVKTSNGADLTSDVITSTPIRVVVQDKTGIVIDGADSTERANFMGIGSDIDYQKDAGVVTVQFAGFESHEHGVTYYDWAVGTTPGGEEVQPFIMAGLIHEESETNVPGNGISSMGFGQAVLPLSSGTTYYTTVRGITNAGNILESTSDGFTVDITPPAITMESYGSENNQSRLTPTTTLYQTEVDSISSSWRAADSECPVKKMYYSVGTYPHGEDVQPRTEAEILLTGEGALPTGIKPTTDGKPNILTLTAENELGLSASIISPYLVVDLSSPAEGVLTCPPFIQPRSAVECTWTGFYDAESQVVEFEFAIGSHEGLEDVVAPVKLPGHAAKYLVSGLAGDLVHGKSYYAKVKAINQVGMTSSSSSNAMYVDTTPPAPGTVVELKSVYIINVTDEVITEKLNTYECDTEEDCLAIDAVCQESLSTVNVAWQTFTDDETEIVKYEIAVGTSPGGGQLRGFFETDDVTKRYLSVTGLVLKGVRQIFVTVKATNGAGLSTISTSNGIYMSYLSQGLEPLTHVGIWDGDSHDGDLDFQTSLSRMGAKWAVSGDPCPVVKYEWAIQRADGLRVQEYFNTEGRTNGVNDQLSMENMERYYQYLRVTNAMDYTYTIRSNGITIEDDPLVPGQVNDGDVVGFDLEFFRTKSKVSANWDKFGSDGNVDEESIGIEAENILEEKSTSQEVAFYEVAVGTDRRFPSTRDNIVPFVNVGLNKTVTFFDLDLTPITATYYFTVRAHSRSGSTADVTSNGFSVGFDGGVSAGSIDMKEYLTTHTYVDVAWNGFESKIGMMMYYVGLSNNTEAGNYRCGQFTERGSITDDERQGIFNIVDLQNVGKDTFMKFENLSLEQNGVYYAWVVGADKAGECNVTSHKFQVDVTPPVKGRIRTGPYYDMKLSYSASSESLQTYWTDFSDEDSGIRCYHAALLKRASCDKDSAEETIVDSIEIDVNYTSYKFMDITMQGNTPYFVRLVAENFAGLKSTLDSPPVLYDNSLPSSGLVIDGHDFTHDISWSGSANVITGTFLHHPVPNESPCPVKQVKFDDSEWKYLESDRNYDSNNRSLTLTYRSANVHPESGKVDIKLSRDTKTDTMFSGTYFRDADLVNGGEYKLSIRAAAGDGQAVTSVLFWDGPDDYILDFDYTPRPVWPEPACACCRVDPVAESCTCNCSTNSRHSNISKRSVDVEDPGYQVTKLSDEDKKKLQETGSITDKSEIDKLTPRKACGLQLFSGEEAKLVAWCGYGDTLNELMAVVRNLEQDPSIDYHQYWIRFTTQRDEARGSEITWCMFISMDGDLLTEQCGIPRLSPDTKLFLGVWNHKNYIPETDRDSEGHLKVWSSTASFRDLVMPADKENLCRYGNAFQGGDNAIVRYEAGIGSASGLSDVVPYQQVYTPCIPCLTPCDMYTCDAACDSSSTDQVKITLNDLNLTETTVVEGEVVPVLYYLTVKAVLGSGKKAISSSDGFNIDTSPPLFDTDVMLYIDVAQGNFTPVTYQGSNDTIKAIWKCNDNESEIVNYDWAIGRTPGGQELQTFVSAGENPTSTNSGLVGLLEHNTTYYVTVRCTNGGGLVTTYADPRGVTVLLKPPLVDDVNTTIEGADPLGETVSPPNSMTTTDQNTVGASWTVSDDESIRRYDFCVGSSEASISDIFPCTWVGYNTSGTVTVTDGYLKVNGVPIYTLSQFKPDYNVSVNTTDKSAFTMAPGTEMVIFMKMCNEAQLCTTKLLGATIVETDMSTMATSSDGSAVSVDVGGGVRRKRDVSGVTVSTPDGLQAGQTIVVTQLTKLDLQTEYKSDASVEFVPYITDPSTSTIEDAFTDRILRKRLNYQDTDLSFSLTSVGNLPMPGPMKVTFSYDPTVTKTTLMLLHWNTDARQWQQSNKTCLHETDTEVRDPVTSQVTVKVCNTRFTTDSSSSRRRRSVSDTYFRHPTQFLLTSALTEIPNSPPQLTSTTSLVMQEDQGTLIYQMTSTDANGDVVKYKMSDDSAVADLELRLSEDGLMTYTPAANFYGNVDVQVVMYEVPQAEIPPAQTAVSITISINSINDAPSAFVFSDEVNILHADPTLPVVILPENFNSNDSDTTTYRWKFGAYDVDVGDSLTIFYTQPSSGNLTVGDVNTTVPCSYNSGIPCDKLLLPNPADSLNWVYRTFQYQPDPGYHGNDEVRVYVQDQGGVYSDVITIKPGVMKTPCRNGGKCRSKNESLYNCTNYSRAESFDLYYECACAPGWTGIHCEDKDDVTTVKPDVVETPCQNGGTCKSKNESLYNCTNYRRAEGFDLFYECACAPGWTGIHCEDEDDVTTIKPGVMQTPCKNGGTCTSTNERVYNCTNYRRAEGCDLYYECACAPGWTGIQCEDDVNECSSSPCSSPYVCYNDVNRYYCACAKDNPNCDGLQAWMIGLVVLAVILIIILSFLAWYLCMLKRGRLQSPCNKLARHKRERGGARAACDNEGFTDTNQHQQRLSNLGHAKTRFDPTSAPRSVGDTPGEEAV